MLNLDPKQSRIFLILVTLIVLLIGFNIYRELTLNRPSVELTDRTNTEFPADRTSGEETEESESNTESIETVEEPSYVKVFIAGQVKYPGVIELSADSRLSDAVELAGGLLEDADLLRVNLAMKVKDEGMYVIPKIGEEFPSPVGVDVQATQPQQEEGKININTADKTLLETLPGIGPSRAQGIIDHRERVGAFATIADIKDVTGIGDRIFEGLQDLITVR